MDIKNFLILISALINFSLGLIVYSKGKSKSINRTYFAIALSVVFWSVAMIIYRASGTIADSFLWCRLLYVAPVLIVCSFFYFSLIFPGELKKINKPALILIFSFGLLVIFLSLFTDAIVKGIEFRPGQEKLIKWGHLYAWLYPLLISGGFTWSYINLIKKYFQAKNNGLLRSQIAYVFWGTFLSSLLSMLTNLTLPTFNIFYFNWFGQILAVIMAGFIAYAIVAHRLMDIKLVARKYTVTLAAILSTAPFGFILWQIGNNRFPASPLLIAILALALTITGYDKLRVRYLRLANRYFFTSLYEPLQVMSDLDDKLRHTAGLAEIHAAIFATFDLAFHPQAFAICQNSGNNSQIKLSPAFNRGFSPAELKKLSANQAFSRLIASQSQPVIIEEFRRELPADNPLQSFLTAASQANIALILPLNDPENNTGCLVFAPKETGDMYNEEDIKLLNLVNLQVAAAIDSAILYEEKLNFNQKLQQEIKKKIAQLTRSNQEISANNEKLESANSKLKELEATKSEFISIASHQLRTPLTVTKGYVSMLLDKDFGQLNDIQRDSLEKVFQSNERLINLVENLLNISRIESGRIQYIFEVKPIEDAIDKVLELIREYARRKGLAFTWEKPAKLPLVKFDEEKIRQVVTNITDNAVKYTKQGAIACVLKQVGQELEYSVTDTGIGIKDEDKSRLFQKFNRGAGTSLIHTEGTGLGLYVAKHLIEAHGGRIWAESKGEGRGAKFCFRIPVAEKQEEGKK